MAYAYVKTTANTANGNTVTLTATAGNLLIVAVETSNGGGSPTWTCTDNLSTVYSVGLAHTSDGISYWNGFSYLANCPAGITTITVTFNGGAPGETEIRVSEYSGIKTVSPLIGTPLKANQNNPGTGTDAITVGPLNVTAQPALIVGLIQTIFGNATVTAGTGYVVRDMTAGMCIEDKRVTATGNQTVTGTSTGGATNPYTSMIAAFEEASISTSERGVETSPVQRPMTGFAA